MSAPDTDTERQVRRHRPALLGIGAAVTVALVLLAALMVWVFAAGDEPGDDAATTAPAAADSAAPAAE